MTQILRREGALSRVSGFFFKAMVQAVLLFRSETWVVTHHMGKSLGSFHAQVARRLMGRLPQRKPDRKWTYTLASMAR